MRIFLSYASEQEALAEGIYRKLLSDGYGVFFASADMRAGQGYDSRIRSELERADRMIFLASPASLAAGCYTLTELHLAAQRWPNPEGRMMAILVDGVEPSALPPYLGAVTSAIMPKGNAAAEVVAAVNLHWPRTTLQRMRRPVLVAGLLALAVLLGVLLWEKFAPPEGLAPAPSTDKFSDLLNDLSEERKLLFENEDADRITEQFMQAGFSLDMVKLTFPQGAVPALPDEDDAPGRLRVLASWVHPTGRDTPAATVKFVNLAMALKTMTTGIGQSLTGVMSVASPLDAYRAPTCWPPALDRPPNTLTDWTNAILGRKIDPDDPDDVAWVREKLSLREDPALSMIVNAWKGMDPKPRVMDRARTLFMAELLQFLRDPGVGDALVLLSAAKYDKGFPQGLDSIPAEIRTLIKAALIRMWERATGQVNVFLRAQYEPHYNGSLCRPDATAK